MRNRNRRQSPAALLNALLTALLLTLSLGAGTATAADTDTRSVGSAQSALAYKRLGITMQAQQKTNWCWAASGNTIATWFGRTYTQNQFCNAAFNRQQGYDCPNNQATLANVQTGLRWAGINAGSYVNGWLLYSTVQTEINADRPIETRIQWASGGGHMHVVYGYDTASNWVYWGDPWPSSDRYNWASHAWYVDNSSFSWTHSLYRIGA
ncbi:papain-like cysteine protease family protein [Streptomyces sp. NPDC059533]|uniref:papain-like cysteine protease family protein n=1 Tax=unclassified Streptomyces TaxID=2593676 RepID=UPI0036AC443D